MSIPDFPWWLIPGLLTIVSGLGWWADGDRVCKWIFWIMLVAFIANVVNRIGGL